MTAWDSSGIRLGRPISTNIRERACRARLRKEKFVKRQAVTGACALMRREVYEAVGGLDEKFLIGDFEDSDLCLKVREKGLEIACLPLPVTLIHLERQSFSGIGTPSFRDYVVRYNAWRHQTRWGAAIAKMSAVEQAAGGLQMKAMVIAHAHPDFSVGGAEIAAYNLFRILKSALRISASRSSWRAAILPSQAHGSIMLRRPGEYLVAAGHRRLVPAADAKPDGGDGRLPRVSQDRAAGRRFPPPLRPHRRRGPARDQAHAAGLRADRDAARICRHLQSQGQMVKNDTKKLCYRESLEDCSNCFPERTPQDFWLRKHYIQKHFEYADAFVSPSEFLRQRYIEWGIPAEHIVVIENGQPSPLRPKRAAAPARG